MVTLYSSNFVPFGTRYAMVGKEETTYTGKPFDSATGLYYFNSRYYDPSTGRFVTEDSYQGSLNDPAALNRYVYVADNPIRYTDPTGHYMVDATRGGGNVVPDSCDAPPTWTCLPDTSGSQTTTTTSTTTTTTTTTSTSGEQTCQQGEVRGCVQPTSTATPSLPSCQGSVTCVQADARFYEIVAATGFTGGVVTLFAESGAIPFDAAIIAGDASALAYLEAAGASATPDEVWYAYEEGFDAVLAGFFGIPPI